MASHTRLRRAYTALILGAGSLLCLGSLGVTGHVPTGVTADRRDLPRPTVLSLAFEPNLGQASEDAAFLARMGGQHVRLFPDRLEVSPSRRGDSPRRLTFLGANRDARLVGEDRLSGAVHYWIGAPDDWRTDIPTYAAVRYVGLYPGVDLVLSGDRGTLEMEFAVAPGADPESILLELDEGLRLGEPATLESHVGGFLSLSGSQFGYRIENHDLEASLSVGATLSASKEESSPDPDEGFRVAIDSLGHLYLAGSVVPLRASDKADAFVAKLTPDGASVLYTAYFGGTGDDRPMGLAVDAEGRAYVAGQTGSTDFASRSAGLRGPSDAFLVAVAPDGNALDFVTLMGGDGEDSARGIALDDGGRAWLAGETRGPGFPVTIGKKRSEGVSEAFVAAVETKAGSLAYAEYLGGSGEEIANAIAVDAKGRVHVAGATTSIDFPLAGPSSSSSEVADADAFIATLDARTGDLLRTSRLGGSADDTALALVASVEGDLVVAGRTASSDFPLLNPARTALGGVADAFVARLHAEDGSLIHSTYLGDLGDDRASAVALDAKGKIWVAGAGSDEPAATGHDAFDAFLRVLSPAGDQVVRVVRLGGDGGDTATSIALAASGGAVMAGATGSGSVESLVRMEPISAEGEGYFTTLLPLAAGCPGTINFDNGGGTGLWQTPANWDTNTLPAGTDDVCIAGFAVTLSSGTHGPNSLFVDSAGSLLIPAGTLSLATASQIDGSFALTGGTLTGAGTLTVHGAMSWTGGEMNGSGVTDAAGTLSISGADVRNLISRTLKNSGTATWTGTGPLQLGSGATIDNTGIWDTQNDLTLANGWGGAMSTLQNSGTFKKSAGVGTTTVAIIFNNQSAVAEAVDVQVGTLALSGGGTHTGAFDATGATLAFSGGTHHVNAGGKVGGGGTVKLSGATLNFNTGSTWNTSGAAEVSAGTVNVNSGSAVSIANLALTGGLLQGTGTVTVNAAMSWTGGEMNGSGVTDAAGTLSISGADVRNLISRTLKNSGTATWTGTGPLQLGSGATIDNTGIWDTQNDLTLANGWGGAMSTLQNSGTFKKSAGAGTTTVAIIFNNQSAVAEAVDVQVGTLALSGGGTHTGAFDATGATLAFSGGTHHVNAGGKVGGGGTVKLSGATLNFNTGSTWNTSGAAEVSAGTVNVNSGSAVSIANLALTGGLLQGTGTVTVNAAMSWTGGEMNGSGVTDAAGTLSISGADVRNLISRTLKNSGTATWTGTGPLQLGSGATIDNTGIWDTQNDLTLANGWGGAMSTLQNSGTFKKSAGVGTTTVAIIFNNSGTLQALAATLRFTGGYTQTAGTTILNGGALESTTTLNIQGGSVKGAGTLTTPSLTSAGEVSPGLSPGILGISGTYTQDIAGRYRVELGGLTPGSGYDQLNVTGAVTLAGELVVDVIGGFTPDAGDSFTLMTFASRGGTTFGTFSPAPPPCGLEWNLVYTSTSVVLQVVAGPCPDIDSDGFANCCHPSCILIGGDTCGDCADSHAAVYPAAPQVCDGLNNDCNYPGWPTLAGTNEADDEGDGFTECAGDCDDAVGTVYPGAPQICDTLNNDCSDPTWPTAPPEDRDDDGDGFRECTGDCADANAAVYPAAPQVCDGLNNDCNYPGWPTLAGTNEADDEGDGFTECAGDCDDGIATMYPGAPQICDALNNNCSDPTWPTAPPEDRDDDGDGSRECTGDCADANAAVYPAAPQVCDGLNNDCNYPGWPTLAGTNEADDEGDGFTECAGDCDDGIATVYPGAPQICDTLNNDCSDPTWPTAPPQDRDDDGDGLRECMGDCNDADAGAIALPVEATELMFDPDKVTLSWTSVIPQAGSATVHDIVLGRLSELPVGSGPSENCLATVPTNTAMDTTTPSVGAGRWYLVRGRNSCGAGTYGTRSNGSTNVSGACP